jgi:hypothetical protein
VLGGFSEARMRSGIDVVGALCENYPAKTKQAAINPIRYRLLYFMGSVSLLTCGRDEVPVPADRGIKGGAAHSR